MLRQERKQSRAEEDELEELGENVTSDIKEWLTATFASKQQVEQAVILTYCASLTFLPH